MSSPEPGTILAIDQGTSGTKAVVVDPAGAVLAVADEPIRPQYLPGGGVEQDAEALLRSVLEAGRRALTQARCPVDAVSLANQGETVLAWDPDTGRALSPAIVWQDRRAEALVAGLADAREWVAQRTGLVLDPYFSAPKMAWLRRNVTVEGVVTTTDSWLLHRLCGEFVTDAATASRSLLTDLDSLGWDGDLLELFAWQDEALPRIVACDDVVGTTSAFGTGPVAGGRPHRELPVAGVIVDQQAALLAQSCLEPGTAKCTLGTGAFLLANTGERAVRSAAGLTSSVAWRASGATSYCLDGQVYTAGSALRWLTDLGLLSGPSDVDKIAADDDGGVLFVPALAGLASPWWRTDARAAFTGMTLSTGPGQLVTSVVRGIAGQIAELADLVEADADATIERLRVDGGLVRSSVMMQSLADVLQRPVDVYPSAHATALGAAALGRLALAPGLGLAAAVPPWSPSHSYVPRWPSERADEFRGRWRDAVSASLTPALPSTALV